MAVRMASRKASSLAKGIAGRSIPVPTGQYTVGCVDLMHKLEGDNDGLLVRLFYPTTPQIHRAEGAAGSGYQYAKWMPHAKYTKTTFDFIEAMVPGLSSNAIDVFADPNAPAFEGAPLFHQSTTLLSSAQKQSTRSIKKSTFPVIVFAHGMGGMRTLSSGICCDLASHGYVVAAVEHRDGSACTTLKRVPGPSGKLVNEWMEFYFKKETEKEFYLRNKQVKQRATDAKQALNMLYLLNDGVDIQNMLEADGIDGSDFDFRQFKGSLDVTSAAVMGHSFGGATTIQTLSEDQRFTCGIGLDSWILPIDLSILDESGIKQPLLFINSFDWQWKRNIQRMMKLTSSFPQTALITIRDSHHFNQTDMPFTISQCFDRQPNMVESRIDPYLAHRVNMELCHTFLRRHLLNDPAYQQSIPILDGGEGCSEYVIYGTNVDLSESTNTAKL